MKGHWIKPGAVVVDVAMNAVGRHKMSALFLRWFPSAYSVIRCGVHPTVMCDDVEKR